MAEFRYTALDFMQRSKQGIVHGTNARSARKRVDEFCRANRLTCQRIEKKQTFLYRIQRGNEEIINGEQRAFTREEVVTVLEKMGCKVLRVEKKYFDLLFAPPTRDIVMFIRLCADLLREKLPFDEILQMLMHDTSNKTLKSVIKEINQDLKDGKEGTEVFNKHQRFLGRFPAYMLSIASTSGDMARIYENTAKFLERNMEFKKSIRQALLMPMIIMFFLLMTVVFYVAYIFPKTANLFLKYDIKLPPMTQFTLDMSRFFQENYLTISGGILLIVLMVAHFFRTERGRLLFDKYMPYIPVVGTLIKKTSIEIFSRVFNALYTGSGDNIAVLRIAAEACRNKYMESRIKDVAIPLMIKEGAGLVDALEISGVFTKNALMQYRSGAESGSLKAVSLQLADYYEKETSHKLRNVIDMINVSVSMVIMIIMIALTIVSSETAIIKPENPLFH